MQDENFSEVQKLIALKRHEQPDDAYFEEFLDEFHRRQRQELLQRSSRSLFAERISTWFSGTNKWNFVWGGGLAYAIVLLAFVLWPKAEEVNRAEIPTTPVENIQSADPAGQNEGDMLTPDKEKQPVRETY
ncbi:MAG: hypothetical protein AB8F34_03430 [Akkermansiaceae bacterium]